MGKKLTASILIMLTFFLFTGCSMIKLPTGRMGRIEGDITCEYSAGKNARTMKETIKTDVVFDKDKFVELYNEDAKYDPSFYKYHLDKLDLKINAKEQPEELEKMMRSEVCVRALFDDKNRNVSLYRYDSKLYFFILCMGGRSKPEEEGYYYKEVPAKMVSYWEPILEEVLSDKEKDRQAQYGSFSVDKIYSYDKKYYAECIIGSSEMVLIRISSCEYDISVFSFRPCRKSDFWGICWEKDNYNIWIQSGDIGTVCYSMSGDEWVKIEGAVKPAYIIGRHEGEREKT